MHLFCNYNFLSTCSLKILCERKFWITKNWAGYTAFMLQCAKRRNTKVLLLLCTFLYFAFLCFELQVRCFCIWCERIHPLHLMTMAECEAVSWRILWLASPTLWACATLGVCTTFLESPQQLSSVHSIGLTTRFGVYGMNPYLPLGVQWAIFFSGRRF